MHDPARPKDRPGRPGRAFGPFAIGLAALASGATPASAQFGQRAAEPEWASIEGTVWDSTTASPLAGARVVLLGTNIVGVAGADGSFRIDSIPHGVYPVSFSHPRLEGTGFVVPARSVNLPPNAELVLDLAIPSAATLRALDCIQSSPDQAAGALVGYVRDAGTGVPLPRAVLTLQWRTEEQELRSDWDGMWLACGVPNDAQVTMDVAFPGREPRAVVVRGSEGPFRRTDVELASGNAGIIVGTVLDAQSGAPVSDAEIQLVDAGRSAVSDPGGRFLMTELEPGTYEIVVRHLAYGEDRGEVRVPDDRRALDLTVRLAPRVIELEPLVVEVTSQEVRSRLAMGTRFDGMDFAEIQEVLPRITDMTGLFRAARVPGLTVQGTATGMCIELNRARGRSSCTYPVLYVDGVRINEVAAYLEMLSPERVERFQIIPPLEAGAIYGSGSQNGVIVVETRAGRNAIRR